MLRQLFPLFFILLSCTAFAQPGSSDLNRSDAQGRKQGDWAKAWPNGKLRYQGRFKDDKPMGEFKHFDEEGRLTSIQLHAGDGKVSRAQHFHPNGKTMAKGKYVQQVKDSTWNYFDTEGQLRKVERYDSGRLHGPQEVYYPNGTLAEKDNYANGKLHGESQSWFDNGNVKTLATYMNGEPEGNMVFYFPTGKKEIEGKLVNGDRDGAWYYFNADGTIQLQALYRQGALVKERKENGIFKEYYDDEQLMSEVRYLAAKREGPFVEYYNNGEWVVRPMPADPVKGTPPDMERVLQGQTKKREGAYKNDLLEGEVKEYDPKGKMIKSVRYVAGEVVGKQ
ncbi:MAG: toxin-antitoxin system YwqK family antitoxin [Flavobacteriales bacterium]